MKTRIVALVPMRRQSKRLPRKNYKTFNGRPLFYWILNTLSSCEIIDRIYIDTDSPVIKKKAPLINKKISIISRPSHLRAGEVPMNDILLYDVSIVDADYYIQTHATNPLLKKETIERAIKTFLNARGKDSLFSVTKLQARLWSRDRRPLNHQPEILLRTQDLAPVYEENSNIYIFTKETLAKRKSRIGKNPIMFEIPRSEAWDIDEPIDFDIAEFLSRAKGRSRK